ncbi:hypothetical protein RHSIM_Rhsim06G0152200 [Rhododendron simsii]|uniref:Uncharacterized protein n=1 Tax=Rhododendron simsii TaxID=118357 RepID=A0A834GS78_RHOSS|nr:hypothetical protein RHSIM_Rhsim06G0152200 [Rhododendron simsii]
MNATLAKDFTPMEIKQALFDMDPTKTPGADGMMAVSTSNIGILNMDLPNLKGDFGKVLAANQMLGLFAGICGMNGFSNKFGGKEAKVIADALKEFDEVYQANLKVTSGPTRKTGVGVVVRGFCGRLVED